MKNLKLYFTLLLLLLFYNSNAQFLNKDAEWIVNCYYPTYDGVSEFFEKISLSKDTTVAGVKYSVMNAKWYRKVFLLREEEGKVFYRNAINSQETDTIERLLYDFNLEKDDTVNVYIKYDMQDDFKEVTYKVVDIDSISTIESVSSDKLSKLKRITLEKLNDIGSTYDIFYRIYWVEKVGSILHHPIYTEIHPMGEIGCDFRCYRENGNSVYGNCHNVDAIGDKEQSTALDFVQSENQLIFNLPKDEKFYFQLYSLTGQLLYSCRIKNNVVSLAGLLSNIYMCRIYSDRKIITKKIFVRYE